jgi:hypothetical protein
VPGSGVALATLPRRLLNTKEVTDQEPKIGFA